MNIEELRTIRKNIECKFIGQEEAVKNLFNNIINNQILAKNDELRSGQRSIIFLDGPSGTGKTAITKTIAQEIGSISCVSTSITNYSAAGYVVGDLIDVLTSLLEKSEGDLKKAERGIVIFDEFDKIAYSRSGGLENAIQAAMLEGKISTDKTVDMELNRLYNIMLISSNNKDIVFNIFQDFIQIIKNNSINEIGIYSNIAEQINEYLKNNGPFPKINDYK